MANMILLAGSRKGMRKEVMSPARSVQDKVVDPMPGEGASSDKDSLSEDDHRICRKRKASVGLGFSQPAKKMTKSYPGQVIQSRQAKTGDKIRRRNQERKHQELFELKEELQKCKAELRDSKVDREVLSRKVDLYEANKVRRQIDQDKDEEWIQTVLSDMPKDARKSFKLSVFANKKEFQPGRISKLRKATGINFSRPPAESSLKLPLLAVKIREFAHLNSNEVPDMKANTAKGDKPSLRTAIHHLTVLHFTFNVDNPEHQCSYTTFCRHWPANIIKPTLRDYTSCHCQTCENSSMMMGSLVKHNIAPASHDIFLALKQFREEAPELKESLLELIRAAKEGPRKEEKVTFSCWEKVEKEICADEDKFKKENAVKKQAKKELEKRLKQASVKKLTELAEVQFKELDEHLTRVFLIKTQIKQLLDKVMRDTSGKSAGVWVDWSENPAIRQDREVQSAFFNKRTFSLHTTYIMHNSRAFGVGSLGEGSDHKVPFTAKTPYITIICLLQAEAIMAVLRPILQQLLDQGVLDFIFVSDSTGAQYRYCL